MLTPTVKLNEPEIATICWAILQGLEYLYDRLNLGYGNINCSNILLFSDGIVKIGKYRAFLSY